LIRGPGDRAARDILRSATMGQAFDSLNHLMLDYGGQEVHYGSAIALATVIRVWSRDTERAAAELIRAYVR